MDEEQKSEHQLIDWFDTTTITVFVTAFICDLLFFLIIPHYLGALIAVPIIWPKTRGLLARLMLVLAFILPLPVLMIGIWLAILLSNKVIAFLAEQVAILTVAAVTAGGGLALEGAAVGGEVAAGGLEAASAAVEVGETAIEGAVGATEAAGVGAGVVEAGVGEGVGAAEETAEAAGKAAEGVESEARESLRDKVVRKLKEKAKQKVRRRLEERFGGYEEEEPEPTEEEIAAEMAREEELAEELGETPPWSTTLNKQLFAERKGSQDGVGSENKESDGDRVKSNVIPKPPGQRGVEKNTQDIVSQTRKREEQWERDRDNDRGNQGDLPMAA